MEIGGEPFRKWLGDFWPVSKDAVLGSLVSASHSFRLKQNIGYARDSIGLAEPGHALEMTSPTAPCRSPPWPCPSSTAIRTLPAPSRTSSTRGMIEGVTWLAGSVLIAGPSLWDPNFRRTVVLIGHHDEEGAVGVILNRPSEVPVAEAAPPLAGLVAPEERLFFGGPVQPEAAVVVADFERPEHAQVVAFGSIGFLPDESDPAEIGEIRRARVFAGHAGWGPGQLEAELAEQSWLVEPATEEDVFTPEPGGLWSAVVRRKGPRYELMARMPFDPSVN